MAPPQAGVAFPADTRGDRSTIAAGKKVFATAVEGVDADLAQRIQAERDWRHQYPAHLMQVAEVSLRSPTAALAVARAGLEYIHKTFEFVRDSSILSLREAMQSYSTPVFQTAVIQGEKPKQPLAPAIHHGGNVLEGDALISQLKAWTEHGSIEPDVPEAVAQLQAHPEWGDLSGRHFLVFGAASEMGPLPLLMQRGAHVIAIGTRKCHRWQKLIELASETSGKLTFPVTIEQTSTTTDGQLSRAAGCDLLVDTPEIRTWLKSVVQAPLTIGTYIYMDGEAHVRASVAVDAITQELVDHLGPENVSLAFLGSPAMACVVPEAAHNAMAENHKNSSWWQTPLSWLCGGFQPNQRAPVVAENGDRFFLVDGFSVVQGPNYALAKTMQMWRAMVARSAGMVVSTPMAPPARSDSVMHNSQVATAMNGLHHFKPLQAFEPATAAGLMSLLLLHDLSNPQAAARPSTPLRNPLELFAANAVHGGGWRCGYKFDSIGKALFICGKVAPE